MKIFSALMAVINRFRRRKVKVLFYTHTPQYFKAGEIRKEGVIVYIALDRCTALINGGYAPCWRVMGIPHDAK